MKLQTKIPLTKESHNLIDYSSDKESFLIYIEKNNEVFLWKEFNKNIPVSIEYNIYF